MKSYKKVIIPLEINENASKYLRSLKDMDSIQHAEVHFVHVFNTMSYSLGLAMVPVEYPVESDRKMIEESVNAILKTMSNKILGDKFEGKVVSRVLFSENAKRAFTNYATEEKPELIIIPTRSKHGFFESSFAAYVNSRTECDVFMLKHKA
jgi:nucleotide-binding universal stress UspA family protein